MGSQRRSKVNWNDAAAYAALVISVVILWTGLKKPDLSAFWKTALYILDLLLILWGVISLGWSGVYLLIAANVLATLVWSAWLAIRKQDILAQAAVAIGVERSKMEDLERRLRKADQAAKHIGPLDRSRLIRYLAERNRDINEIEALAVPIATLWVIYRPDVGLPQLVEDFDRLLRIWRMPVADAMKLADKLVVATQHTAGSYSEVVHALLTVGGATIDRGLLGDGSGGASKERE